jgi:hypothetical protein
LRNFSPVFREKTLQHFLLIKSFSYRNRFPIRIPDHPISAPAGPTGRARRNSGVGQLLSKGLYFESCLVIVKILAGQARKRRLAGAAHRHGKRDAVAGGGGRISRPISSLAI